MIRKDIKSQQKNEKGTYEVRRKGEKSSYSTANTLGAIHMIQPNQCDTEIRMKYERSFTRRKEMPIATIPT